MDQHRFEKARRQVITHAQLRRVKTSSSTGKQTSQEKHPMTSPPFVSAARDGEILTLQINSPELRDGQTVYAVRDELVAAAEDDGIHHVIVDLAKVGFMGSIGLLALLSLRRLAKVERIILCNLSETVRGVMVTTRLAGAEGDRTAPFEYAIDEVQARALLI